MFKIPKSVMQQIQQQSDLRGISKTFIKKYPKEYRAFMKTWPKLKGFSAKLYATIYDRPKCLNCDNFTSFVNFQKGFKGHCSLQCARRDPKVHEKTQAAILKKWGGQHYMKNSKVASRFEATMIERHGAAYTLQSDNLRRKGWQTLEKTTGASHPSQLDHWQQKMRSQEVQDARVATFRKNLGVDNPQQRDDIFRKGEDKRFEIKEFIVCGKTYRARGYEPYVITELIKRKGYKPEQVLNTAEEGCSGIWYTTDKRRRYHPDLLVVKNEKQARIEVKSTYTIAIKDPKQFAKNKAKWTAASAHGEMWLAVVCTRARKIAWIKNPHCLNAAQMRLRINNAGIKV